MFCPPQFRQQAMRSATKCNLKLDRSCYSWTYAPRYKAHKDMEDKLLPQSRHLLPNKFSRSGGFTRTPPPPPKKFVVLSGCLDKSVGVGVTTTRKPPAIPETNSNRLALKVTYWDIPMRDSHDQYSFVSSDELRCTCILVL
jgi:hypothetical protein